MRTLLIPVGIEELKLPAAQRPRLQQCTDQLDLQFFPLRNKSREDPQAGLSKIMAELTLQVKMLLQTSLRQRLTELLYQRLGTAAAPRDDLAKPCPGRF